LGRVEPGLSHQALKLLKGALDTQHRTGSEGFNAVKLKAKKAALD
jgi:hypothetical protein